MLLHKSLKRIKAFGLKTYLSKKLFYLSPKLYYRIVDHGDSGFVKTAYGVDMHANWQDDTFRMCVFGQHGNDLSSLIANLSEPFVFLDVGANQGLFSLLAARNPACIRSIAFEPVKDTFDFLQRNADHSTHSDRITCVNSAVSSENGTAEITINDGHSGSASLSTKTGNTGATTQIQTMSGDAIETFIPPEVSLFVKIDVEGFEETVIAEILKLPSSPRISHVYSEIDRRWVDFDAISSALAAAGLTDQKAAKREHFDLLAKRP